MTRTMVVGGGIVGASAAFRMADSGNEVVLVDKHDPGHATAAGAGIIAPGTSMRTLPAFYPFAADAVRYYPELVARLAELGAGDTRYDVVGKLFVATNNEEFERLPAIQQMMEQRRQEGMPNLGATRMVSAEEARSMFPALGEVAGAIHVPEAARVDGGSVRDAMVAGARTLGATILQGNARLLRAADDGAVIEVEGTTHSVDRVIVAAGSWTNTFLEPIGVSVHVAPQKGQIMHIEMGETDTSRWPIIGTFGDQYILTFGPNRVVCGATRETGSGYDLRTTPGGLQSVTNAALRVAPGLANGTVEEVRVGLRPLSDDGLPFIGEVEGHGSVVMATGHGPSGLQLGPWSGVIAAELALGRHPSSDISAFRPGR
ncbi:MAG: FAD-binding oxidoreductase [Chloroflexota bacterium]|nr:FAD-binding oxidoreductase [Chloroflexota bacterium]